MIHRFFWAQSLPEQKSRTTTQLRVVSVLANWTTRHSHDFLHDIHILEPLLLRFLDRIARDGPEGLARPAETLRRRLSKLRDKPEPALFSMPTPKPILPKSMSQLDFLDLDPEEIARQILLVRPDVFSLLLRFYPRLTTFLPALRLILAILVEFSPGNC